MALLRSKFDGPQHIPFPMKKTVWFEEKDQVSFKPSLLRLAALNSVFFVALATLTALIFFETVYYAYDQDQSHLGVGLAFELGIYKFSYKLNEVVDAAVPYTTAWTTEYYPSFCSKISFMTRSSNGMILDHFFCSSTWTTVQTLPALSLVSAVLFFAVLLCSVYYRNCSKRMVTKIKILMIFLISVHLVTIAILVAMLVYIVKTDIVALPSDLSLGGIYPIWAVIGLDVVYITIFSFADKWKIFQTISSDLEE